MAAQKRRMTKSYSDPGVVERILTMYEFEESIRGIAKVMDLARRRITKTLTENNIKIRPLYAGHKEHITFNGRKYRLRSDGYWKSTTKPETYLHRDMWEKENGKIEEGHEIHHKDDNKSHNETSNFESLTKAAHGRWHYHKGSNEEG